MAIAGTVHVDGVIGSDAHNGTTRALAVKTLRRAIALAAALGAGTKRVVCWRGRFTEGEFVLSSSHEDMSFIAPCGNVIFDGESHREFFSYNGTYAIGFAGITFLNYMCGGVNGGDGFVYAGTDFSTFVNCVIAATTARAQAAMIVNSSYASGKRQFVGCTFYSLKAWYNGASGCFVRGSIFISVTDTSHANWTFTQNASTDAHLYGTGGIDMGTYPHPLVDPANEDFTFDTGDAQYAKYMTGGYLGGRCGAGGRGGIVYIGMSLNADAKEAIGVSNHPSGTLANDELYYQTGSGPGSEGPSDAGPILVDANGDISIDTGTVPAAKSARAKSAVLDFGEAVTLKEVFWSATEAAAAVIDNSKSDVTREIEVRGDADSFSRDALAATTDVDWTLVARGVIPASVTVRYWQFRVVARTDGTT